MALPLALVWWREARAKSRSMLASSQAKKRKSSPEAAPSFAEPISLSSTTLADHRLPPAAFETGLDLLALRARRVRESTRVRPPAQGAGERKSPQIRHASTAAPGIRPR
jgi:hypothetical protein